MSARAREPDKWCPRCRKYLPRSAFHRNSSQHDGLSCYCRDCNNGYFRARYANPAIDLGPAARWDIDAHIASIEARTADDLTRGGSAFTNG